METPNNLIIGRPTKTDDDPVMAKIIKIRMSSQRALTTHLCCNFFIFYLWVNDPIMGPEGLD